MNRRVELDGARLDLRRSSRVPAQLPVVVQGKSTNGVPFANPTRAVVLSAHGCLITLSESVRLGERLILQNVANREEQDCRVVYVGEKHGGRAEVGLRFKTAAPQFWSLEHAPSDWKKIRS
jgi:PilZ domain-containing protein